MRQRTVFGSIAMLAWVAVATASASCSDDDDGPAASGGGPGAAASGGGAGTSGAGGGAGGAAAAGGGAASAQGAGGATGGAGGAGDVVLTEADFGCILEWPKVRRFRITNKLDALDDSLAVANDPGGADYPVGTLLQLVPNEAMLKRRPGFSAATNDWEFFFLEPSPGGTVIKTRGTADVVNSFGGNCLGCHAAAERKYDFVCESGHGCDPLPATPEQIEAFQQSDPRCTPGGAGAGGAGG